MTSNMGSNLIRENFSKINDNNREEVIDRTKAEVFELLKQTIRPEFLNRIDELIMFAPLNENEIKQIVGLQVNLIKHQLQENGVDLQVTEAALAQIAKEGFDPQFGARPVKRVIQREVLNELSKRLIAQTIDRNKPIVVDSLAGVLTFGN